MFLSQTANADVSVTGVAGTGEVGPVLVWGRIIPDQNPSYTPITPTQNPSFSQIAPNQNPSYTPITPSSTPSWSDESPSQTPGWDDIAA